MKVRTYLYKKGALKQHRINVPVISVGNLTMGGTGKTPFVIFLARLLKEHGFRPAIISRGYHGKTSAAVNIVSDGKQILMTPDQAGDEPVLMAKTLPSTIVATGKKRYLPALEAVRGYQSNLILLDDGFQHLPLFRDIDLVLFDIDHFAGNSRVFPGGELREPVSALNRCTAFLLTGLTEDNSDRADNIKQLLNDKFPDKQVFLLSRTFSTFYRYGFNGTSIDKSEIAYQELPANLLAFSGIANPTRFYGMLDSYGIDVSTTKDFGDHHAYNNQNINELSNMADVHNCSAFITTEKDLVKLKSSYRFNIPVYVPVLEYNLQSDLITFITDLLDQ